MKRRIYIVVLIMFIVIAGTINGSMSVKAQDMTPIVSPNAIVDFEEEAIRIEEDRGYFNSARKAKIRIMDEAEFFDEDAATKGIKIRVRNANGDMLSFSKEEVFVSEWVHSGNVHTAEIKFGTDGNYDWEITYTNLAGKQLEKISTGKSVTPFSFTIDRAAPYGEIKAVSKEGMEAKWSVLHENWKHELFSRERITVSGVFNDEISAVPVKIYYYKANKSSLEQQELDSISNWKDFSTLELEKDQSTVIYFKIVDAAGNYTYLNTGGLVIDSQKPVLEKFTAQAVSPSNYRNGIYNSDVRITVEVSEPLVGNTFSGIRSVSYQVFNLGVETQANVLWNDSKKGTEKNEEKNEEWKEAIQTWKGQFVVDSQLNNSNDVKVVVRVQDCGGNIETKSMKLKIDVSEPVIRVSYDNNNAQNKSFFSKERIGTIVVQERNFRPEDVQIKITNSENKMPILSEWMKMPDSGNQDNTDWMLKISYVDEGDYTFHISYSDLAGNRCSKIEYGVSVSPTKFTIDKTLPMVTVQYDNNSVANEKYYNASRTATIEIIEHNLDMNNIEISIDAKMDGEKDTLPEQHEWKQNGDQYITQISYLNDGEYVFDISVTDKAGNKCVDYTEEIFVLDTTPPLVKIKGVENNSANRGDIYSQIICTDNNYVKEQTLVTLTKYNGDEADFTYAEESIENGICYVYENVPRDKEMDGSYELKVTMTDKAGNHTEKKIKFSVNRFGSSYVLGEDAQKINYSYVQDPIDLIVKESNVDLLNTIKIILFKNDETILLKEGVDYSVMLDKEDNGNYQYTYTILAENFQENGVHHIYIQSEDEAGNLSDNNADEADASIRFGVDNIEPNLMIRNLEDGKIYESETWTVYMSAKDNFVLNKVTVYLDKKVHKTWTAQELKDMEANNKELTFDIAGDSIAAHRIKVVCTDEAGNEHIEELSGFYVTTNKWVRLWKNKLLLYGIALGVFLVVVIWRIVVKKRSNPLSVFEK